ncbi:MAG: ATP-binding protein [Acidobacteria bacterium]|jgi:hypothetical protein|nr:ATP-binding protein [Acidobacteriota bacterium]
MAVKTTIGHPARENDYFDRSALTSRIWEKIQSGSNLLMSAPRRVGKSSIMFHFLDNPPINSRIIYIDTEAVNNENEFFKKLFHQVVKILSTVNRYSKMMTNFTRELGVRIESVGIEGIAIGNHCLNYYDEFLKLLKPLEMKNDRLVIMLDEFAETVQNIIKDEGQEKAIHFLQSNRTLRMMPDMKGKIQFILAGSIGLENIVENLNASATINDLYSFPIPPLSNAEAKALTAKIIEDSGYIFAEYQIEYMLQKIEWLIPFYIQLIVDEIDKLKFSQGSVHITENEIDKAFLNAIEHRNYFTNWHTRLRRCYTGQEYTFTKALLNHISEFDTINSNQVYDLAVQHNMELNFRYILNALKYDGYINNNDEPRVYRFNSPLLKTWWFKNVAF